MPVMSSPTTTNSLQVLWDNFIHAEPQSDEKSSWLDLFLAELLAQVQEGRDVKDVLSFGSVGGGGISNLVACNLLSDVHKLCAATNDGGELIGLQKYLVEERGWRSLAVLHLLGVRGLSCARELVALLVALYPVACQEGAHVIAPNPYLRFHCNDNTVDTVDIIPHPKQKSNAKIKSINIECYPLRKRPKRHGTAGARTAFFQRKKVSVETKQATENASSESDMLSNGIAHARSLTLKVRLNPMDFEYFTSVVRSDEEHAWEGALYELPHRPMRKTWQDFVDDRIKTVLDCRVGHFEASLLIIQLLQGLRAYATPTEQTPAVQVLKFALDTLWALQFGINGANFTGTESATLKAAASRLMLGAMERVLRADEPTNAVIHNGLLPMMLRLLEDACSKPVKVLSPEEGSLLQEFIFATTYGIITFLHCLLHQRGTIEKLNDFMELFQLFTESQEGRFLERTILTIIQLPSVDRERSVTRARKVIDMIGALTGALKHVRQDLCHMAQCHRSIHRFCVDGMEAHHHDNILGVPYIQPVVGSISKQICCISTLFMTLISLTREAHSFPIELQVRLLKVITATGTCCCFSRKTLLSNIVIFLKKKNPQTYGPSIVLLERTLFKELGGYPAQDTCRSCIRTVNYSWDFLEMYCDLLIPEDPNLCYVVMAHLLRVTPNSSIPVRHAMLFKVFHRAFLNAKHFYVKDPNNLVADFIIQSCLSVISCLVVNGPICEKFTEMRGLEDALSLLPNLAFTRLVYTLLEVTVILEICKSASEDPTKRRLVEAPGLTALFSALERETTDILAVLEDLKNDRLEDMFNEPLEPHFVQPDESREHESIRLSTNEFSECKYLYWARNTKTEKLFANARNSLSSHTNNQNETNGEWCMSRSDEHTAHSQSANKDKPKDKPCGGSVSPKVNVTIEMNVKKKMCLFQASAAWRAAAGVVLSSPGFRRELLHNPLSLKVTRLLKVLAMLIATDKITDTSRSAHRLIEALITCCLTSPICDRDIITELSEVLINAKIKLGRGIVVLLEAFLRVSMLKLSQEQTMPPPIRPKLPPMTLDSLPDCGGEDSSTGEYVTADDGYEADVDVQGKSSPKNVPKRVNPLDSVVEPRGHANAHPALCSLAVDLLMHFSAQGLEGDRGTIVGSGLRRVAVTCRESASSCAALAGSGAIAKILDGFKEILKSKDPHYQDLQHSALEVFTLLATQSISPSELVSYLSLFKSKCPPLLTLLEPLFRLVLTSHPQPNFILAFPVPENTETISKIKEEPNKRSETAENLVNNFRNRHLASGICSPWSVHATCLPLGPELSWPVWLNGFSASMWLRVERGLSNGSQGTAMSVAPVLDFESESPSDWSVSDNWSRKASRSVSPSAPTSMIHLMSVGLESMMLETWLDLRSDKLIIRLTLPDDKTNRTISEAAINSILPAGRWHHMALNYRDTILNKCTVVEVTVWIDGWREGSAQLPFDGFSVRKPATTCVLLGQTGSSRSGAWYLGNLMIFRCPVFTREKALYLAGLGPNYTNLADCILNSVKPDFAPLIASGALNAAREFKLESGKFDLSRRKSYGGTYLRHAVETMTSDTKIDWNAVMDATDCHLGELQDNILLSYEAQTASTVRLYPQAVANPNVVRNLFSGQPGFRVISAPEHRVSQQPPLSIAAILTTKLECQQYKGLVPTVCLAGGIPVLLYLFARVVELNSTEEEQALALSIVLHMARSDSELLNQYRSNDGSSLLLRVLESPRCYAGKHILKAILDAACSSSMLTKDIGTGNHVISQHCDAVVIDPALIKSALGAWRTWAKSDSLNLFLQALLMLLRDQHSHREFNSSQFNRVGMVETILLLCKEHFLYEELGAMLDPATGNVIVELIRALMGAPPEFSHLVAITDYLLLVHQASETYITHSRHNLYFLLPALDVKKTNLKIGSISVVSSYEELFGTLEASKLNKALDNEQIQRAGVARRKDRRPGPSKDNSGGDDSGIAASDSSNHHTNNIQSTWTDDRRACQGLVCEGLFLLLRDALRVLPDSQVGSVLKHVLRAELLLVLANHPDPRVRTAIIKVIQIYLQRSADEDITKFIKQKYFLHLANQISLYPGSEPLTVALQSLATRGPTVAAMPPLLAMMTKAASTNFTIARSIVCFVTDMVAKQDTNSLRGLLEQGLAESLARSLVGAAHKDNSASLFGDIHVLLVAVATKLLESPGNHHMQAVSDLHLILNHMELKEMSQCGTSASCVSVVRSAQVVLFDGELDALISKVANHSVFRLRSTASYLASASYLTSVLTTSSEQSDHESRSSSYGTLHSSCNSSVREPGRGEMNERFRTVLIRAVEFITTANKAPSSSELQLTRKLFSMLLHGLSSPPELKNYSGGAWSSRPALKKITARIMVWLLGPHQSNNTRVYAVRSLMEEPKGRDILSSLLAIHPQVEQKFTVFFWDLLRQCEEMPNADARVCDEMKEALNIWDLVKGIERATPGLWDEELAMLRRELMRDREIWLENNLSAIHRIGNKFDVLGKQVTESAMTITRSVVEEQNRERKILMERLKYSRGLEAQATAKWRILARRLTHERAPWYFAECYPRSWELDPTEGPARVRIRLQRCHLAIHKRFLMPDYQEKLDAANVDGPLSYLFMTVRQDTNATALIERLHTSERIRRMSQARVVTPQAESPGEALIGESCLYFIPDNPDMPLHTDIALGGLDLAMTGGTAWKLEDIRELHKRRYQLQETAIEIFLVNGRTYLLTFNSSKERDEFAIELSACNLPRRVPGDDLDEALALWRSDALTNWEYITCLNKLAGRSYNDLMQYPVFPFVLSDYTSNKIDLNNPKIYRNFERPMAVQDKKNEQHYVNSYNYLKQALAEGLNLIALNQEPFHYGSHYSNSGTVLHFLVRLPPFTSMFLCYQDDNFDLPDRTFHALATTWRLTSCDSTTDVKELIPEFFYLPEFLLNSEGFNFGVRQDGCRVGDVELPPWCGGDARLFILAHRAALETDIVREVLPYWIDLVFGFRQTGRPAVEAINVFHPATYYGFDVEQIEDPLERQAWETMVKTYGQTPAQLFKEQHPLPIQSVSTVLTSNTIPQVLEGVYGIKWGNYVGAPGNEPVLCWKHKHRAPMTSLVPLITGDVFVLPTNTTPILGYNKAKGGSNMLSGTSVLGAGLASWGGTDGIVRLKTKKEQRPRPLLKSYGYDPITILAAAADCGELWVGHLSGRIMVYAYSIGTTGKIEFDCGPASTLLAHRSATLKIALSRAFSIAVSGDAAGVVVIWDLNSLSYVRSICCNPDHSISLLTISETLGDIAVTYKNTSATSNNSDYKSELRVFTINARPVGSVLSRRKITALCYSNALEGVSVNVIATGLDNGVIRLWSSWDLRLVREIVNGGRGCGAVIAVAWALDQHHLYAAMEDSTIIIWEGIKRMSNGTPKFIDLTSL